jgi:hypothetical protein
MVDYGWHDFVGNIGVALIVFTYAGIQAGKLLPDNLWYSVANGAGALLIMISLMVDFNLSSFIIECVWLLVSVYGLVRHFYGRVDRRAE